MKAREIFRFDELGTDWKTETVAGTTSFLIMAYTVSTTYLAGNSYCLPSKLTRQSPVTV